MQKILLFLILAGLSALVGAQTQLKTPQPAGKTAARTQSTAQAQARAAAEATAQAQAQAIALAAASVQSLPRDPAQLNPARAGVQPAVSAALRPASVMVPGYPAPVALTASPAHSPSGPTFGTPTTLAIPAVAAPASAFTTGALPVHAGTDLASDQMAIAERVHQGVVSCELGASVRVEADAGKPGYFHVLGKGFRYHMHPVRTTTGAIRLEDAKAGAIWLQLANKSMLMDQTKGRRVADECAHPEQVAYAKSMKTNPPPSLFDTTGMGRSKN